MILSLAAAFTLATQCAPSIAPETLLAVVQVESGFEPLAIGVNGAPRMTATARTAADAAAKASALIAQGRSVDLGLAQINSRNLGWLGLSIDEAFDACRNLAAAARVLQAGYLPSGDGDEQPALLRALSRYNTGDAWRGFANGYVAKVQEAAARFAPALRADLTSPAPLDQPLVTAAPPRQAWDVFGEAADGGGFLIRVAPTPLAAGAQS